MLLAIDCGNTNTGFAVFRGEICVGNWRTSTNSRRTADEYAVWLTQLLGLEGLSMSDIEAIIIANVVPDTAFNLMTLCQRYFGIKPMIVGEADVILGMDINIDDPKELGADRIVNAIGAMDQYSGPLIVIDFGTATTFDVVDENGAYSGGVIAPGINLSLEALYNAAARLPRITIVEPGLDGEDSVTESVVGKSTRAAMNSGIFWGYIGLIEGIVGRIKLEVGRPMSVIATGGMADIFAHRTDLVDEVDHDITYKGLVLIYRRNHPCP
ncbi:MAG: pantothenate kinase [Rhodospirillaceae bacterium]|nr:pantothenate kinase [Rhodospirillaceae bacterium]